MDAITMQSTRSLIKRLRGDFPGFTFESSNSFWWSASQQTIHFDPTAEHSTAYSLHELSHAILGHHGYEYDIDLVKLERDAWDYAKRILATEYDATIDTDIIQNNLDTYRDWLHARSECPSCEATGLQTKQRLYRCLACGHQWRVNEARICALRRYSLQTK